MKTRHTIILFMIGWSLEFLGALLKILHWEGGDETLLIATVLKITGLLMFCYKLLSYPKVKEFLDW